MGIVFRLKRLDNLFDSVLSILDEVGLLERAIQALQMRGIVREFLNFSLLDIGVEQKVQLAGPFWGAGLLEAEIGFKEFTKQVRSGVSLMQRWAG